MAACMQTAYLTHFFIGPPNKITKLENPHTEISLGVQDSTLHLKLANLEKANKKLESEVTSLKQMLQKAKQNIRNLQIEANKEKKTFYSSKKSYSELNQKRKFHKKLEVKKWLLKQFSKLPSDWKVLELKMLIEDDVDLFNFNNEDVDIDVDDDDSTLKIQKALKAKDDGDISDVAYHELKQLPNSNLPSMCSIKKERSTQNSLIPIYDLNQSGVKGCRRSIADIIQFMMKDHHFKDAIEKKNGDVIDLRFSGDGRKTTKKLGSVMTTFSVPTERRSPDSEYCISIYDGKESRDILSESAHIIFDEMDYLKEHGLNVEGDKVLQIDWLLCADWKFMAILLGINSPSSEYFCLWCDCCKKLIRDFSIPDWLITRTYSNCVERAHTNFKGDRKGVQAKPLLNVDFKKVIPDTLHLLLRIRGKLLNQVACWAIEQKSTAKMENAMSAIGVPFNFYESQDQANGKTSMKWTSLDCDDLETVVKKLDLTSFLNNMADKSKTSIDCLTKAQLVAACKKYSIHTQGNKDVLKGALKSHLSKNNIQFQVSTIQTFEVKALAIVTLQVVWREFEVLADALKADQNSPEYLKPAEFKALALKWVNAFRKATFDEDVIPYIHVLVYHVPQFLELYGTIHHFNCQTVEKKNHLQNRAFHRASQKGGRKSNYTIQIMEKENRKMFARVANLERTKRKYTKKN